MTTDELYEELKSYLYHQPGCPAGRPDVCSTCLSPDCGAITQHFQWGPKPCAHCECKAFTVGPCTCGLDAFEIRYAALFREPKR